MKEHTSTTFNWEKFKEASIILAGKETAMIGSNEDDWTEYNNAMDQSVQAKKARLVQSGIDPDESFNTVRGGLIAVAIVLACVCIVWLVT